MDPAASSFAKALKRVKSRVAHAVISVLRRLPAVWHQRAAEFGQSVEFAFWVTQTFGAESAFFATRERLWRRMISCLRRDATVTVYEFGVAYGHTTRWWLSRCSLIDRWYGFDTFTGLPRAWRHFPAGAFDAGGVPPEIADARIEWIVGKVEDTFAAGHPPLESSKDDRDAQRVFLFDLDLYEPTKCVAERVFPQLRPGDLVYFDEAAHWDERRVLIEELSHAPTSPALLGATPMALALQAVPSPD